MTLKPNAQRIARTFNAEILADRRIDVRVLPREIESQGRGFRRLRIAISS